MQLILLRHGQSVSNASGKHQGKHDPLSNLGEKQSHAVGLILKKYSLDKLFSSDYIRAIETAAIVNTYLKKPIKYMKLIGEIRNPSVIIGKKHNDPKIQGIRQLIEKNFHNPGWRYSDEENFEDVKQRTISFLDIVENQKTNILAISHGMFIRVLLSVVTCEKNLTSYDFLKLEPKFKTEHTCISICKYEYGKWKITLTCDSSHLQKL